MRIHLLQVVADGNAQIQQLVDVAKQSSTTSAYNATALLANMSGIAAVQQGSMAQEVRSLSTDVGQSLQSNPNYVVPPTLSSLQNLKSNFTGDALAQKVAATGLTEQMVQDALNNSTLPTPTSPNAPVAPAPTNMDWVAGVVIGVVVGVSLIVVGALWYTGKISLPVLGRRQPAAPAFDSADRYAVVEGPVAEGVTTVAIGDVTNEQAGHPSTIGANDSENKSTRAQATLPDSEDMPAGFFGRQME